MKKEVVFLKVDEVTGNNRKYPKEVIEKALKGLDKTPVHLGQGSDVPIIGEASGFKLKGDEVLCTLSIDKEVTGFPALRAKGEVDFEKDIAVVKDAEILSVDLVAQHSDKNIPSVSFSRGG